MNVLRYCTLKFWLLIDKLNVYGIQFTIFGSRGGRYFRGGSPLSAGLLLSGGSLISGFTSSHQKIDLNFGGSLLSGLFGSLKMNHPLWTVPLSHSVCICTKVFFVRKCFAESNKMKTLIEVLQAELYWIWGNKRYNVINLWEWLNMHANYNEGTLETSKFFLQQAHIHKSLKEWTENYFFCFIPQKPDFYLREM